MAFSELILFNSIEDCVFYVFEACQGFYKLSIQKGFFS